MLNMVALIYLPHNKPAIIAIVFKDMSSQIINPSSFNKAVPTKHAFPALKIILEQSNEHYINA